MDVLNQKDVAAKKIETVPYRGTPYEVKSVWILSEIEINMRLGG